MDFAWLDQASIPLRPVLLTAALLLGIMITNLVLNRAVRRFLRWLEGRIRLPYGSVLFATRFVIGAVWSLRSCWSCKSGE